MTRENAKELLPIIKAYSEGRTIQCKNVKNGGWLELEAYTFNAKASDYRIKPEYAYRPFKNVEECWNEMLKHEPFGWVKAIGFNHYVQVYGIRDMIEMSESDNLSYEDALHYYTFADGTTFGVQEENE